MSAFDKWIESFNPSADEFEIAVLAWNAALEQAATVCDEYQRERNKFTVKDGQEGYPYVPADCASAIRARIKR